MASHYRRLLGLPPFRLEERLCAAAAHSRSLVANRANGHFGTFRGDGGSRPAAPVIDSVRHASQ